MMRERGILLGASAALLLAGASPANARDELPPFPQGLYGNVELGEESGDLGGFEVRFTTDRTTGRSTAEFVLCEGWCNVSYTAEVMRDGDGSAFSHEEVLEASDGTRSTHTVRCGVVPKGGALLVTYTSQDGYISEPWRIRRLREPWGLEVARDSAGEPG